MPYYQEASGVLPDSITDDKLANMPEARVKGRAVGAGEGDPQDLTGPQITEIIGPLIGPPSGPAGGDLVGLYPDPVLVPVGPGGTFGDAGNVPRITVDTKGRITAIVTTPVGSGPPTGAAGGDLAGTYPNPTIVPGAISWVEIAGAPASLPPSGPAGGVLGGSYPNPNVLSNNSVFTGTIVDGAVTSPKIANANVTSSHIAANAITTPQIADGNITNVKLATMADGTIKGRAAGAGAGVPQDLTLAQMQAILGTNQMLRHDCRLNYVNNSVIRLNRHGGMLLTINGVPRVIPQGGVDLVYNVGWGPGGAIAYVYATWSGSTIQLALGGAPTENPADGNMVSVSDATATLVGAFVIAPTGGASFYESDGWITVLSYWNRKERRAIAGWGNLPTSSTSPIELAQGVLMVADWGEEPIQSFTTGYAINSIVSAMVMLENRLSGTPYVNTTQMWAPVATGGGAMPSISIYPPAGAVLFQRAAPYVWTNAGMATFWGTHMVVTRS